MLLAQTVSGLSVRMIYREKGGSQAALFENIDYCAIMGLQNAFLSKCFSDPSGTQVRIMEFILDYFILVFLCESLGM